MLSSHMWLEPAHLEYGDIEHFHQYRKFYCIVQWSREEDCYTITHQCYNYFYYSIWHLIKSDHVILTSSCIPLTKMKTEARVHFLS